MVVIKLKQRVLIPFLLASAFLFALSLLGIYAEEEEHIEMDVLRSVEGLAKSYQALLRNDADKLTVALEFIAKDAQLTAALRAQNRQGLLEVAQPLFKHLHAEHQITHFYFHDARRTNILRVHQPDRYGDAIERFTAKEAEQTGRLAWGVELGPLGTFTLRAVMPWWDKGQLIGYVELGEEIEGGIKELSSMYGVELFVLVSKQYLERENWEAGMQMLGRSANWELLPDLAIHLQTLPDDSEKLLSGITLANTEHPLQITAVPYNRQEYRRAFVPLLDAGQRRVGSIMVLRDMTQRIGSTFNTILTISAIAFLVGLTLLGLFYVILERAEQQLESRRLRAEEEAQARHAIQEEHVKELERLALYDSLTGLPNRKFLDDRLNLIISATEAESRSYALMLLSLDHLREINNTLGHEVGDHLLKGVAERLTEAVLGADTVACFGGNEFALLLPEYSSEIVNVPIERVMALFNMPFRVNGTTLSIVATVGVAHFPEHAQDASTLIRRADIAMRQAREKRRNWELYDSVRDPYSVRRLMLATDLRKAIEAGELFLHYQPQVVAESSCLEGVEALARWNHPEHGAVSPAEFIPLAEQTGLIEQLTLWVLDEALRQCAVWVGEGLDIKVSVNLSAQSLIDVSFPDKVASLLLQRQVATERLVLEVTESVFMLEPEHSLATLNKLKSMGIALSIDDFGTGYSSLAYLKQLPVHELKIDQGFIFDMLENENDAMIVSSTVNLAHGLGLRVVAEGVETKEIWDNLMALGCDIIQGYYVAKPMPAEELVGWLDSSPQYKLTG